MRKLIESTFVTLDGVISSPHVWGPPYWDEDHNDYAGKLLFAADALLLGRATYEGFAQSWPGRKGDPYADRINSLPKYVATTSLEEADAWNGTVIQGDVATAVAELKRQPGKNILKFGTGELDRALIANGLVDEFHFWMFPAVAGSGDRLLDGLDMTHLDLLETTRFKSGIVVLTYGLKGR
ncbi:dihydrofolate reductase family protein [Nonomuraea sp. LPB2021202275-12-8]|uniref:dihydrofolate reductase family protein n=1 Tax=Nonomuraea sp. LPB2021202275-12-8 TaxID=3120159 RepID=UPI00300D7BDE